MPQSLLRDERASVSVIIAALLLVLIATAGFAFDYGRFYLSQSRDQFAADIAVSAAAIAYNSSGSETTAATQACIAAAMNGIVVNCAGSQTKVTTSLQSSPKGDGSQALKVVVSTSMQLSAFGAMFNAVGQHNTLPVNGVAWAEIVPNNPPCLLALSPSTDSTPAINLSGSASISAAGCGVQAGGPISVSGAADLGTTTSEAQSVVTGSTIELSGSGAVNSVNTPQQSHTFPQPTPHAPTDPYATNSTVTSDFSHLTSVSSNTAPSAPSITAPTAAASSNTNLSITSCPGTVTAGSYKNVTLNASGCTFSIPSSFSVNNMLTLGAGTIANFTTSGTYDINSVTTSGAGAVIQASGSTFNITNGVTAAGSSTLTFGCTSAPSTPTPCSSPSENTFNIAGGVTASSWNSWIVFGNSDSGSNSFTISGGVTASQNPSSVVFGASRNFTIAGGVQNTGSGSVVFGNGGTFSISGGVNATSGSTMVFGNGTTFTILGASNAAAISGAGAAITFGTGDFTIAAASGQSAITIGGGDCSATNFIKFGNSPDSFIVDGPIALNGGCFTFGNAPNHDINAGSSSTYAINNPSGTATLTFGTGTYTLNGGVVLAGASTSTGSNMTLVMSGDLNLTAGANNVNWNAPSSAPFLALTTSTDGGTGSTSGTTAIDLSGGTNSTVFNGVLYAPNGGLSMSGSANINHSPPAGSCFALAAKFITQSGGTASANVCPGTGSGSGAKIVLVQ